MNLLRDHLLFLPVPEPGKWQMKPVMYKTNRGKTIRSIIYSSLIVAVVSCGSKKEEQQADQGDQEEISCVYEYGICVDSLEVTHYEIGQGQYLASILADLGFEANQKREDYRGCFLHLSTFEITGREFLCHDDRLHVGSEICGF